MLVLLLGAVLAASAVYTISQRSAAADTSIPTSAAMEQALGVRFSRVAVVGDGGLVEVSYVVLDADKATQFQARGNQPPVLRNERTGRSTRQVSLMRLGHALRVGQTYYFLYHNAGTVRSHDRASLTSQGVTLAGIPVL